MNDIVNPLTPAAPDFTPPSADVEISAEARAFATSHLPDGEKTRAPSDAEQVQRLQQARDILGEKFWQTKVVVPSAAEKAAQTELQARGIKPGAQPGEYTVTLPAGVDASVSDTIKTSMASLELSPVLGSYIATRIGEVGRRNHQMPEVDHARHMAEQDRRLAEFASSRGWDLDAKRAEVAALLKDKKVDSLVAGIIASDSDLVIRLMMHAEHLKSIKKG